ncbi:MAG: endopeptidase La [Chloroflexi bacterium]|nr:endopeptidase La [Chloroflexota bacterium]
MSHPLTFRLFQAEAQQLQHIPDAEPDDRGLVVLPVLPLRDLALFPGMVLPLRIGRPFTMRAVDFALERGSTLLGLLQRDAALESPQPDEFFPVGVEIAVSEPWQEDEEEVYSVLVQARRRLEVVEWLQTEPFFVVRARVLEDQPVDARTPEIQALMRQARTLFQQVVELAHMPPEANHLLLQVHDPGLLADMLAAALRVEPEEAAAFLAETSPVARLKQVLSWLAREISILQIEDQIQHRVQEEMDRFQRETYLREQIKAIQNELGEGDLWGREVRELRERIEKKALPAEARKVALREVERLGHLPPMSPEVGILRNYIEWILDLPWQERTEDNLNLRHAAQVLDAEHYGLQRAKERILEYIAVLSLKPKRRRQPILCFVGPPGTGKTSLGRSIAKALGREFVRVSLGGVRDEAEIRGHRRTYVGALPGRILQTMKRAGTVNPVFMLDEIDKLGADFRGDPAAALLEVLDPEQNAAFSDHYLEIPYDLSQVFFITTANTLHTIPPALADRMEVIEFPGYVEEEKVEIARRFLIPRQVEESGLEPDEIRFTEPALRHIIRSYTDEAGVRELERQIGRVCRKVARLKAEGKRYPGRITPKVVERFLGPPEYFANEAEKQDEVGVATALAWTYTGGEIMPVEVLLMEGKGNLTITGQIGQVMQESAQAAVSYLRAHARAWDLDPRVFDRTDIHIHVPEGAVPKDGPSAGVTIITALVSAFTGRQVRHDVGLTGEITLRGKVLPIGGVREKVLAAHRAGLKVVLLPKRNLKDLVEVPKSVREALRIKGVRHVDEVLRAALRPPGPDTRPWQVTAADDEADDEPSAEDESLTDAA